MKDAQTPSHITLSSLVTRLRDGCYTIPDFQREFEWKAGDIQELMRSIFLDYYIGSLLLWKGKDINFEALSCEPLYGCSTHVDRKHIILDGQQRLTAMYYAFFAPQKPLPNKKNKFLYFIRVDRFMDENYEEAFTYDWTNWSRKLVKNSKQQFEGHYFPLKVIGDKSSFAISKWLQQYEEYWEEKGKENEEAGNNEMAEAAYRAAEKARKFGEYMQGILEDYRISYIELDCDLDIDKVCDIFTKINSSGSRLDIFDLMNALLKPKGIKLKQLWREASPRIEFIEGKSSRMNVYILQVMSILRQAYCSPKYLYYLLPNHEKKIRDEAGLEHVKILIQSSKEFKACWDTAVSALEQVIKVLRDPREFGAIASRYLPYAAILPAFAALWHDASQVSPDGRKTAYSKVRCWYWASVFHNRYSSAVESTTTQDYQEMAAWFSDNSREPRMIKNFREQFTRLDLLNERRRGTAIYAGIFNLLILEGARDWITGKAPQHDDLDDHHIVPRSWGLTHGCKEKVDSILNRTPLTAESNRTVIRDELPNKYLPRLERQYGRDLQEILATHFVSEKAFEILKRVPFSVDDLDEFLDERRRTILAAIERACIKTAIS